MLNRKYRDREWILDDESYFTKTHSTSNGNDSGNIDFAPANVKFRKNHKYEKKLLVWIAMSPRGISEPFIMASGNAVDQFVYRDNCLALISLLFIKKNHSDGNYIFWPDQAAVTTLNIHWTFYARIWFTMSIRENLPPIAWSSIYRRLLTVKSKQYSREFLHK